MNRTLSTLALCALPYNRPAHHGRHHGVSGYGMTIAEFEKIVQSLRPIREDGAAHPPK